jgi:hypothetical protein
VQGRLLDRLAEDGSFPELDQRPLEQQFPLGAWVTARLISAHDTKVPLMRGSCPIVPGLHHTHGRPLPGVVASVHHYKWSAQVMERTIDRLCTLYAQNRLYWRESEVLLSYVKHYGRLRLDDPALDVRRLWPPPRETEA